MFSDICLIFYPKEEKIYNNLRMNKKKNVLQNFHIIYNINWMTSRKCLHLCIRIHYSKPTQCSTHTHIRGVNWYESDRQDIVANKINTKAK